MSARVIRAALVLATAATLAACANENNAIPFDPATWSLETDARGNPYSTSLED